MDKVRLGDICDVRDGTHDSPKYHDSGYPLVTSKNLSKGFVDFTDCNLISKEDYDKINIRSKVDVGDILMPMIGTVGNPVIVQIEPEFAIKNVALIKFYKDSRVLNKYIKVLLGSNYFDRTVISKIRGGTQKFISLNDIRGLEIILPPISEQLEIVDKIEKVNVLIGTRKEQLEKLNELVKARFVELFGNPDYNEKGLPTLPMTDLCEIIDGDRGKNYPKQEEFSEDGFCLFLNAKNVTSNGFSFENCMYITEEKDKILRNGKLSRGDVVLTTRGTLGNLAFYDESVPYEHMRINSGMVILRMKRELIAERFFIEQFKMQLASIKEKIANGSAQPQLPISTMNKIMMLVPNVEQQNQFAAFVERTDKSKLGLQKSLEKLELLKKALMQKYFG